MKVLVVLSYPTFEATFLKNFIASKGNEVVLAISAVEKQL
jgi:hypothetical protein